MSKINLTILFYVNSVLITAVNLILICALYLHFIKGQRQAEINWLLGVFATEILASFVYGWHKTFAERKDKDGEPKKTDTDFKVIDNGVDYTLLSNLEIRKDPKDPSYSCCVRGIEHLDSARETSDLTARSAFLKNALQEFQKIPDSSQLHFSATYGEGAVYKWRGDYPKALEYFAKAKKILDENENLHFSPREVNIGHMGTENMIGLVYSEMQQYAVAENYFKKSWSYDHNYFAPIYNLFDTAFKKKDVNAANSLKNLLETYKEYAAVAELIEIKMNILNGKYFRKAA